MWFDLATAIHRMMTQRLMSDAAQTNYVVASMLLSRRLLFATVMRDAAATHRSCASTATGALNATREAAAKLIGERSSLEMQVVSILGQIIQKCPEARRPRKHDTREMLAIIREVCHGACVSTCVQICV